MQKIWILIRALKAGSRLAESDTWKVRQNAINAIMAAFGVVLALSPELKSNLGITDNDLLVIAGGIATIGGIINTYITTATTRKIGAPGIDRIPQVVALEENEEVATVIHEPPPVLKDEGQSAVQPTDAKKEDKPTSVKPDFSTLVP